MLHILNMIEFPTKKLYLRDRFYREYVETLNLTLHNLDFKIISLISNTLKKKILKKKNIFVCGNGGSGSVANHFLCDFNKGIRISSKKKLMPKIISLTNTLELITAIGNDLGFDNVFSFQLENYAKKNDCIILFSCSGTSKNIIKAIKTANELGIKIIFITGFNNKKVKNVDIHLDLNCKNYGITEDIFSSLMHMISQKIRFDTILSKKKQIVL